jgi:membrane-associated phospholipid phosphatase
VGQQLHLATLSWAYQNLNANPVAAFPSLHAAYPVLAYLYLRQAWPRGAWLMLAWGAVVIFAIVYLGHHYVIDAIGGVAYALAVYWAVSRMSQVAWIRTALRRWRERVIPAGP